MSKIYLPYIEASRSQNRKLKDNPELELYYKIMCYTIDHTVGYSLYQVLKRVIRAHLDKRYKYNEDVDDNKKKNEVDLIMKNFEGIVIPDNSNQYKPSYVTHRMVINRLNVIPYEEYSLPIKDTQQQQQELYRDLNEETVFELITNILTSSEKFYDEKDPIIDNIRYIVNIYFKTYYDIAINECRLIHQNYCNITENQIIFLKIFIELIN